MDLDEQVLQHIVQQPRILLRHYTRVYSFTINISQCSLQVDILDIGVIICFLAGLTIIVDVGFSGAEKYAGVFEHD